MKTLGMMVLILAGCLVAGVAGAQTAPGMHGTGPKESEKGMSAGEMMKECQAMMAEREAMTSKMKAMDEKLDQLVARMEAASADLRVEATGAVIGALVAQHRAMREMVKMEGRMMAHTMRHMHAGTMESPPMCPMMKEDAAEAPKSMKADKDAHGSHH